MGLHTERTAVEWYAIAAHWYTERHQGCACCESEHCVFRSVWGQRIEYHCSRCDFSACHDDESDRYYAAAGTSPLQEETELESVIRCVLSRSK